ncbi:MAG TPA: WG repeat-containing protein, partial [Chitinophagaceae bacterium]|nr:WG repeat-containing protein [Chitinophagaceae bacterium]
MRRIVSLACLLVISGLYTHADAQSTIYEALKVQPGTCPLPLQKIEPKKSVENKPAVIDDDITAAIDPGNGNRADIPEEISGNTSTPLVQGYLIQHLDKIQKYLAQNPAAIPRSMPVFTFVDEKYKPLSKVYYNNGKYILYNQKDELVWTKSFRTIGQSAQIMNTWTTGPKSEVYDNTGKLLFDKKFDCVFAGRNELYSFVDNGKYGVTDKTGRIIIPARYSSLLPFKVGDRVLAIVFDNGAEQVIDATGKQIAFLNYATNWDLIHDRYWFANGKLYDLRDGKQLFCTLKTPVRVFNKEKGIFFAEVNGRTYWYDVQGKLLMPEIESTEYIGWDEKIGWIKPADGKRAYGLVDTDLKWMIKPVYSKLRVLDTETIIYSSTAGKMGVLHKSGKILLK